MTRKDHQPVATFVLFAIIAVLFVSCMAGCSTAVPLKAEFPAPPDKNGNTAMTACPQLKELNTDPKISEISKTINVNYGTYYECAVRVDTWIEWYNSQKKIFDNVGK